MEDSPIFLEFTKALAMYTQFSLNAHHGRLMKRLAHDLLLSASDEDILDPFKLQVGFRPRNVRFSSSNTELSWS